MKVIYHGLATISGNHSKCMMTQLLSKQFALLPLPILKFEQKEHIIHPMDNGCMMEKHYLCKQVTITQL